MKKGIKISVAVIIVLVIAFFGLSFWTRSHSPADTAHYAANGLDISVDYCKPYKRDRAIFGGLVPHEEVWRTGANEATTIEFKQDVKVADKPLKAGKYSLWTIPGESMWSIIFNEETGQWGTSHDPSKDVLEVKVPSQKIAESMEQFNIEFVEANDVDMVLSWENTVVMVPIVKD